MFQEFKEFVNKGNALDLAVGVIIGAAFGKIVDSLVNDILMPIVGLVTGGVDFSSRFLVLSGGAATFKTVADARAAGLPVLAYGLFLNAVVQFFLVAFAIFVGVFLAALLWRASSLGRRELAAFGLLLAGGLSNLVDRLVGGGVVVDFLNLGVGALRTGIFNVADVAITAGALLLLWATARPRVS